MGPPGITGTPLFIPVVHGDRQAVSTPVPPAVTPTSTPTLTATPTPTQTASATPTQTASATTSPGGSNALLCSVRNIAWTDPGKLLRGGSIGAAGFGCLAAAGVAVLIDQRHPAEVPSGEADRAAQAGLEYINLGIPDDTAPSPTMLRAWMDTVSDRLAQGKVVLVYDAGGRGRMGFWDAVYLMQKGGEAATIIENRYLAKALPFNGAKLGCSDGGNGQVQALAEIGDHLTGVTYIPQVDEYGTLWANCARPAYMNGWDYGPLFEAE
jgi:hypothetical protein